jgi:cytochrome c biogenesis protein CcdA
MVSRRLHRAFPVFFAYVLAQIATFVLIFPIYRSESVGAFFYAYWGTTAVSIFLGFRVLHEVFLDVFRPYHTLRDLGSVLFKWAGLVMLLVAGVVAASTPASDDPILQGIMTLQRSMRVVQVGLVIFLLVFSRYLGITWRQKSFGIALGFGWFASVELVLGALIVSHLGPGNHTRGLINMAAYNMAVLVWLGYAMMKSPAREDATHTLRTQRWEQSLSDIQHPRPAESLIPMFESMVDRALSRTHSEPAPLDEEELATSADNPRSTHRFSRTTGEVIPKS